MNYTTEELHQIDKKHYLPTFRRYPKAFKKGQGSRLWDMEGKEYIDALAGIAVNNVGHCHPKVVAAIKKQAEELIHISNFFVSEPQVMLAEKLSNLSGLERVFFSNSGAEAVEGVIKIARKYASKHGRGGTIMTMKNAFHGRTLATIAATAKAAMMQGFGPIPTGFCNIPFNNMELVREKVNQDIAAIMLEPIQGEGGIIPAEKDFLVELRAFCDEQDVVLIFDEVQCGIGRTGRMFAFEHYGVRPDLMSLAKGLGGGVPIGAAMASEKIGSAIEWGDHGTTFGGNPLVCAASLATLEAIEEEDMLAQAQEKGSWFQGQIIKAAVEIPEIKGIRGEGLMLGVVLDMDSKPVVSRMMDHGVIANATAGNVVRIVPPLNIPQADLQVVLEVLIQSIKEVSDG